MRARIEKQLKQYQAALDAARRRLENAGIHQPRLLIMPEAWLTVPEPETPPRQRTPAGS